MKRDSINRAVLRRADAGIDGISAGASSVGGGTVVFSNSNNVSFGLSGQTVTASASFAGGIAIAAGTQTATSGTVVMSNSNGLTFGMSGSSQITASMDAVRTISASNGSYAVTGNLLEMSGDAAGTLLLFTQVSAGRSIVRVQAAAVQLGVNNGGPGTTLATGTVVFSSSNGVSFGVSTNVNGGTITASFSPPSLSFFEPGPTAALVANGIATQQQGSMSFARVSFPNPIAATQMDLIMGISNSSSAGGTVRMFVGVYTMSGSTASLASSATRTFAYNSTLGGSSYTNLSGTRYRSMSLGGGTWNITPGDYYIGFGFTIATALTSGTYNYQGHRDMTLVGADYTTSYSRYFGYGIYSTSTTSPPNSVQLSEISMVGNSTLDAADYPWFGLIGTF